MSAQRHGKAVESGKHGMLLSLVGRHILGTQSFDSCAYLGLHLMPQFELLIKSGVTSLRVRLPSAHLLHPFLSLHIHLHMISHQML